MAEALVGGFDQLLRSSPVVGIDADANTDAERGIFLVGAKALFDALSHCRLREVQGEREEEKRGATTK